MSEKKYVKIVSHFSEKFEGWAFPATCFVVDWQYSGLSKRRNHTGNDPFDWNSEVDAQNAFITADKEDVDGIFENWNGLRLNDVCYISKGMVLHRHSRYQKEKNTKVDDFKKDDLIISNPAPIGIHCIRYVDNEEIGYGKLLNTNKKYIEYGPNTRVPENISRPTFPELHNGKRILLSRTKQGFSGVLCSSDLIVSDNTIVLKKWDRLKGISNQSTKKKLKSLNEQYEINEKLPYEITTSLVEKLSTLCSEELLLGIFISSFYKNWITKDKRHKHNVVPDVVSDMPIPLIFTSNRKKITQKKYDSSFVTELKKLEKKSPIDSQQDVIYHIEQLVKEIIKSNMSKVELLKGYLDRLVELFYRPVVEYKKYPNFIEDNGLIEEREAHIKTMKLKAEVEKRKKKVKKVG